MSFDFESVKQYLSDQYYSKREHLYQSNGVTDRLRPITTDLNGLIDASLGTGVFILADGTTANGNATVVAKSASNTPLTLKLAASQTADGFRLRDSSDIDLIYANRYGDFSVGGSVFNDYEDGGGDETAFYVSRTFTSVNGHFSTYAYLSGGFVDIGINDTSTSATHTDNYVFGIGGQAYTYPTCTYVPYGMYGLRYLTYNLASRPVQDMIGALIDCETRATSGTDSLIGAKIIIAGASGTIATGRAIYLPAPANSPYTLLAGLDIESFAISGATTAYAIRTQGGQTLHQTGAAATVGLVVQGAASQSADLTQWKNSAGTVLGWVGSDGKAYFATVLGGSTASGNLTLQSTSNATKGKILFGTSGYDEVNNRLGVATASPTAMLEITDNGAAVVGVIVTAAASQTADLTQWKNSAGTVIGWVDKDAKAYFGTVLGGSTASGNLTLSSTSNATKGKLLFGTSAYDEVNNRLGVATASPAYPLDVVGNARFGNNNTLVDANYIFNGPIEICPNSAQNFRFELDADGSAIYLQANEYYSGGWQLYDTGKAPAQIRITCASADSSIGFYTKAANTAQSTLRATINKDGMLGVGNAPTAYIDAAASTTAAASIRIRSGTAPTTPNSGDLWYDGTNLKFRDGGTTRTITWV